MGPGASNPEGPGTNPVDRGPGGEGTCTPGTTPELRSGLHLVMIKVLVEDWQLFSEMRDTERMQRGHFFRGIKSLFFTYSEINFLELYLVFV